MNFEFEFSPLAKSQYYKAIEWYEEEKKGLGKRFVESVNDTILKIDDSPLTYQIRHKNIRMLGTKKFPFCVYYEMLPHKIRIHGILHERQNRLKIIRDIKQ